MVVSPQRTATPSIAFQTRESIYYRQGDVPLVQLLWGSIYDSRDTRHVLVAPAMIYGGFLPRKSMEKLNLI